MSPFTWNITFASVFHQASVSFRCMKTPHPPSRELAVTPSVAIRALVVGHIGWRWILLPYAIGNGPHHPEGILRVANCAMIALRFDFQVGAGPFEWLIAIVVFAIAPFPIPAGVEFHGTAPAILVADHRRNREPEALCRKPERLAVKVGVPGVHRSIRRGEYLHQARPDLGERWFASKLGIGDAGDFRGFARHGDIWFAERVIHHLAVLIDDGNLDDLAVA